MTLPSGHVIEISKANYERLRQETKIDDAEQDPQASAVFGRHPVYGDVSLSCVDQPAAHPNRPSYTLIIVTNDDNLAIRARSKLEVPFP